MTRVSQTSGSAKSSSWREVAALTWVALFLIVFFAQTLPNNQARRIDVLEATPYALLDALDPPQDENSAPRGLAYLGQRLPLWATAALIAAGAWGLGVLLCGVVVAGTDWDSDRWERFYLQMMLGLSTLSLLTLALGYCGLLSRGSWIALLIACVAGGLWRASRPGTRSAGWPDVSPDRARSRHVGLTPRRSPLPWWLIALAPFLLAMLLGSVSPPTDFDVKEYHLGGPKEWFLRGRIEFLEYNIYTSFPFLTEMLLLDGMVVYGDWYWGGIAGQAVLMLFAPLTALGVWLLGRRLGSETAGQLAAVIYLSTPWIYRISIIAYAEGGLTAYLFAAVYVLSRSLPGDQQTRVASAPVSAWLPRHREALLAGLFAGSAMACKYPGLVSVVAPIGVWLAVRTWRQDERQRAKQLALALGWYTLGVVLAVGPWLLKNWIETGNPVYPLAYSVFGGRDLDPAWAEQWHNAHGRHSAGPMTLRDLLWKAFDVAAVNDWQSPLVFAFAPLAILSGGLRKGLGGIALFTGWVFLTWWLFTHHIDRFWVPLLPTAALLAGCGAAALWEGWKRYVVGTVLATGCAFNLVFCATGLGGYNAGLTDLAAARRIASQTNSVVAWLNAEYRSGALPKGFNILSVGEAQLFDAEFPYLYNTVFDKSLLEEWCAPRPGEDSPNGLRDPAEIRAAFAKHGVTHVLVNWGEILRYRRTYGYAEYVHPARFAALQEAGVLASPLPLPQALSRRKLEQLSTDDVAHVKQWAPELIVPCDDGMCFITGQVFPVR